MSQTPHYGDYNSSHQPAPNDTQAMYTGNHPGYGQPAYGQMPVAPDAEQKLKRSQMILLATAGTYLLAQILGYVLAPATIEVMGETVANDQSPVRTMIGTVVGLALFALVYSLMAKHKKAGRITGYVFAALGIVGAALSTIGALYISLVVVVLSIIWLILAIVWIVAVSNRSVSSILR